MMMEKIVEINVAVEIDDQVLSFPYGPCSHLTHKGLRVMMMMMIL